MKVAIVNSKLAAEHAGFMSALEEVLVDDGHQVSSGEKISDLPKPISYYDVAVAHPFVEDQAILAKEIRRRESFRWIIPSVEPDKHCPPELFGHERVYMGHIESGYTILNLINNGW